MTERYLEDFAVGQRFSTGHGHRPVRPTIGGTDPVEDVITATSWPT